MAAPNRLAELKTAFTNAGTTHDIQSNGTRSHDERKTMVIYAFGRQIPPVDLSDASGNPLLRTEYLYAWEADKPLNAPAVANQYEGNYFVNLKS